MSIFSVELVQRVENVLQQLRAQKLTLATAESCTGGLVSALLTEISGSSDVFTHGFVTYANAAKIVMLGVPHTLLEAYGAVSEEVACAMAEGALRVANADVAIAITGIAGPSGATVTKPVGLVHIACARVGFSTLHHAQQFTGARSAVRLQAVEVALALVERQAAN
jgi:nicotinamide-nucleotide amidase